MSNYEVLKDYPLIHNGTEYAPGSVVEMTEKQAEVLVAKKRLRKKTRKSSAKKKSAPKKRTTAKKKSAPKPGLLRKVLGRGGDTGQEKASTDPKATPEGAASPASDTQA